MVNGKCEICGKPFEQAGNEEGGNICPSCFEEAMNPPGALPCPELPVPAIDEDDPEIPF